MSRLTEHTYRTSYQQWQGAQSTYIEHHINNGKIHGAHISTMSRLTEHTYRTSYQQWQDSRSTHIDNVKADGAHI